MNADTTPATTAGIETLNVTLKFPDVNTFAERFANFLERTRILLPGMAARPLGTRIRFQLKLKDNTSLVGGVGHVEAVVTQGQVAGVPPGLLLQFEADEACRPLVDRILGARGDGRSPVLPPPSGVQPLPVAVTKTEPAPVAAKPEAAAAPTPEPAAQVE